LSLTDDVAAAVVLSSPKATTSLCAAKGPLSSQRLDWKVAARLLGRWGATPQPKYSASVVAPRWLLLGHRSLIVRHRSEAPAAEDFYRRGTSLVDLLYVLRTYEDRRPPLAGRITAPCYFFWLQLRYIYR